MFSWQRPVRFLPDRPLFILVAFFQLMVLLGGGRSGQRSWNKRLIRCSSLSERTFSPQKLFGTALTALSIPYFVDSKRIKTSSLLLTFF